MNVPFCWILWVAGLIRDIREIQSSISANRNGRIAAVCLCLAVRNNSLGPTYATVNTHHHTCLAAAVADRQIGCPVRRNLYVAMNAAALRCLSVINRHTRPIAGAKGSAELTRCGADRPRLSTVVNRLSLVNRIREDAQRGWQRARTNGFMISAGVRP